MEAVEEYRIIEGRDLDSLAKKVNAALKEGWQPHGAPSIHCSGSVVVVSCQAMVKFRQPTGGERIAELRRRG